MNTIGAREIYDDSKFEVFSARNVLFSILEILLILSPDRFPIRRPAKRCGFSLIELLVVVAIISIMAGLLTLGLQGVRAPAIRSAASQVTSGLSLARQVAITKNTKAALFIANDTGNGRIPYRHWSVGYLDKSSGNWTLAKKWEPLPEGAVFLETLTTVRL